MAVDLVNRDPNGINSNIQVAFEDVLAEPDGIHSFDCVWNLSYSCFECGKNFIYKLVTLCCGTCMALELGCEFGCLAVGQIWSCTPALRQCTIVCGSLQKCSAICVNCLCGPMCDLCGNCLGRLKKG